MGVGVVGAAYHKMFPEAVLYDPYYEGELTYKDSLGFEHSPLRADKKHVNECDLAIVAVFTPLKKELSDYGDNPVVSQTLDTSIVEEVIEWIDTPLILIKSALQPGTTDMLQKKFPDKKIAVSVEFIGEGNYYVPPQYPDQKDPTKHQMLIIGGEQKTAEACAEILWSKMSPTVKIHIVSALEAEITKLVENSYGALKVTFINTLLSLAQKSDTSFMRVHQAWQSDPRTDSMHLRAVSFNRGWFSKCWSKDCPALVAYAKQVGADDMAELFQTIIDINERHLALNEDDKTK